MRQTASGLNRGWLAVLGVVLLLGGALLVIIATGALTPLASAVGVSIAGPDPQRQVIPAGRGWNATWVAAVVVVTGVVLALLGIAWLIAQVPRRNQAKPFRLHDSADRGLTRCEPGVLADAIEQQTEALAGVNAAAAVVRGTAQQPDLTLKVTASDRADIAQLIQKIDVVVAGGVGEALDTQVRRLGVQIEIDRTSVSSKSITV